MRDFGFSETKESSMLIMATISVPFILGNVLTLFRIESWDRRTSLIGGLPFVAIGLIITAIAGLINNFFDHPSTCKIYLYSCLDSYHFDWLAGSHILLADIFTVSAISAFTHTHRDSSLTIASSCNDHHGLLKFDTEFLYHINISIALSYSAIEAFFHLA